VIKINSSPEEEANASPPASQPAGQPAGRPAEQQASKTK